jgi:hypothetical protein
MRSYSEEEKGYLVALVNAYSSGWKGMVLKNLVYSIYQRSINIDNPGFELKEGESDDEELAEKYERAIKQGYIPISNFFSLLIYLKSNHLIMVVPFFESEDIGLEIIGTQKDESSGNWFGISTSSYLEFLISNYSNFIYPTQELIDLVKNDFKTIDQRRFEEEMKTVKLNHTEAMKKALCQIRIAWMACAFTIITLIATLGFNYCSTVNIKSPKIEEQLNQIKFEIHEQKQPDVINANITNDTLKVFLLKPKKRN